MHLHVLTAVTRPGNLPAIFDSLYGSEHPAWSVFWHIHHLDGEHSGGQKIKNALLDQTPGGWVYILDDDTILHPRFLHRTAELIQEHPEADLVFFARSDHGNVFQPAVQRGSIDIGQALIQRQLIDELRIPDLYDGDGWFLEVIRQNAACAVFSNEPLSFYNRLR